MTYDWHIDLNFLFTVMLAVVAFAMWSVNRYSKARDRHEANLDRFIALETALQSLAVALEKMAGRMDHADACTDRLRGQFDKFSGTFEAFMLMFQEGTYYRRPKPENKENQ